MLPSSEDVAFFHEHDWWISPEGFADREGTGWHAEQGEHVLRKNDFASLTVDELARLVGVGWHTDREYWGAATSERRRAPAIHLQTGDNRWSGERTHDLVWCPRLYA